MQWSKDLFSKHIKIKSQGEVISFIKNHTWSSFASVEFDDEKYGFYKKSFFTNKVSIAHIPSGITIGSIERDLFNSTAKVKFKNENYNWKSGSFWNNKFFLRKDEETLITYEPKFSDGNIYTEIEDKLLVATGMYIFLNNKATAALLIIFMIIIFSATS